jgi:hypothetical protein
MIELMTVIGEEVSENFSPTHRAKLVSINELSGDCTMEVTESPYVSMVGMSTLNVDKVGMRYTAPVYRIWNAFFY